VSDGKAFAVFFVSDLQEVNSIVVVACYLFYGFPFLLPLFFSERQFKHPLNMEPVCVPAGGLSRSLWWCQWRWVCGIWLFQFYGVSGD